MVSTAQQCLMLKLSRVVSRTIIGKDYRVTDLGYSVGLNGDAAFITQQDGAYLSGDHCEMLAHVTFP